MEKQSQSAWRGPDGHRRAGIRRPSSERLRSVRSRACKACGRGLGRRVGVDGYIAWTDSARMGRAALAQLLRWLNADVDRPTPRVASTDTKVSPIPSSNCFGPTGLA